MQYITRGLEETVLRMNTFFKAVLITGARQVGKTTMLQHLTTLAESEQRTYVSLDDMRVRDLAVNDPALFFQTYTPPMLIDEVQYAPELFPYIKMICDKSQEYGLFWLTGSQQYSAMKRVRESLAGRIGIIDQYSFSYRELSGTIQHNAMGFSLPALMEREKTSPQHNIQSVYQSIWQGWMPQVVHANSEQRTHYYNSYIETYLMRDVFELGGVTHSMQFRKFLTACAALIGHQVHYKKLAEAADISEPTAKEWLQLLKGLGVVYLLQPFFHNQLKRLTKRPKLYFTDTGLAAYLAEWPTPETLMHGAASGHYFENYVVMEYVKNSSCTNSMKRISYYRDGQGKEIDLLLFQADKVHPFEIKKSATPKRDAIKTFSVLDKASSFTRGEGGIICMAQTVYPIDRKNSIIPCGLL